MKTTWSQSEAIELCKRIESFAPQYGFHVALTGGCLYRDGERSDIDLIFYRDRRYNKNVLGLLNRLAVLFECFPFGAGSEDFQTNNWRYVLYSHQRKIDVLFPQYNDPWDKRL